MSKNRVLIVGGVVLAVVLIVAGVLLFKGQATTSSSTGGATASSTAASGSSGGSQGGSASKGANGGSGGNTTAGGGSGTSGSSASSGSDGFGGTSEGTKPPTGSTLKTYPPVEGPKLPAQKMTAPAIAGAALTRVLEAPGNVTFALGNAAVPEGTTYVMRVRPYGFGPPSIYGSRLVVRVDKVTPGLKAPAETRFTNAIMLVLLDTTRGGAITKGGTYDVVVTFRSDGQRMIPVLSSAKAID
jgi:hypothetical protein